MDLMRWSPLRDLDELFSRQGRLIDSGLPAMLGSDVKWRPAANIVENETEFTIKADLPEVRKEDIDITVESGVLTLSGERRYEKKSDDEKEHRRETFYGSFTRSFALPEGTDESAISAESKDGVLLVHVPKVAATKRQPVSIRVD